MQDLYDRLGTRGFDVKFLRRAVLPDWWDDQLASEPFNRALAEAAVSKALGFAISQLRDPGAVLPEPLVSNFRLKRHKKDERVKDVRPAVFVAERLSKLVLARAKDLPKFDPSLTAEQIRKRLLAAAPGIGLSALVEFAWEGGVVVIHVDPDRLPKASKKFAGVAMFCGGTPVVVLGSGKDGPPWLAFHLAHELGHLYLGHVTPGDPPLVDSDIERVDDEPQEKQADAFANTVLTGGPNPGFSSPYKLSGEKLADAAVAFGKANGIDPGTLALYYARSTTLWGAGQKALQKLGMDTGAHAILGEALAKHVDLEDATEATVRFLSCLSIEC
jgi:hypothetical protein